MSGINVTDWTIPGSNGKPIIGNTHWPEDRDQAIGWLICCHGFKGYKDYGFFPLLCDHAANNGLLAARFNFSHSGMTNNTDTFERPDLFEKDTWGRQQEDLLAVFEFAVSERRLPCVVFGHSRGGVTSTLFAGRSNEEGLVGLITAAAPDYACNLDELLKDQLRAEGRLLSPSGRTGQDLYVGLQWLEEIEGNPAFYDPALAAAYVNRPMLILHGDKDNTVPSSCSEQLHRAATPSSKLVVIKGANHVFDCPNPLPSGIALAQVPGVTQTLIEQTVGFAVQQCAAS